MDALTCSLSTATVLCLHLVQQRADPIATHSQIRQKLGTLVFAERNEATNGVVDQRPYACPFSRIQFFARVPVHFRHAQNEPHKVRVRMRINGLHKRPQLVVITADQGGIEVRSLRPWCRFAAYKDLAFAAHNLLGEQLTQLGILFAVQPRQLQEEVELLAVQRTHFNGHLFSRSGTGGDETFGAAKAGHGAKHTWQSGIWAVKVDAHQAINASRCSGYPLCSPNTRQRRSWRRRPIAQAHWHSCRK